MLLFGSCRLASCAGASEVDTVFAEGFHPSGFARLSVGDDLALAEAAAGTPLAVVCGASDVQTWRYSQQATGAQRFEERALVFRAGRLAEKVSRVADQEIEAAGEFVDFMAPSRAGPDRARHACAAK
jgi:hypothetical protein